MRLPTTLDPRRRRPRSRRGVDGTDAEWADDWEYVEVDDDAPDDGWEYVWVDDDESTVEPSPPPARAARRGRARSAPDPSDAGATDEPAELGGALLDGDEPDEPSVVEDPRIAARRLGIADARRTRRRRRLVVLAAIVGLLLGALALTRSSALDVDTIAVTGASRADVDELIAASGVHPGDPLVGLDLEAATAGVSAHPWVRDASVERTWSGDVTISVVERTPVATVNAGEGGWLLVDGDRRVVAASTTPPALPIVDGVGTAAVGATLDPSAEAALDVAAALTPGLRTRVGVVHGADPGSIELALNPTGTVRFGPGTDLDTRIRSLQTVFAQVDLRCLATVDLRVSDAPVLTRVPACA